MRQPQISLPSQVIRGLAVTAVLGLVSCTGTGTGGADGAADPLPGHWLNGSGAPARLDTASLAQWWKRFRDPVLNQLIGDALRTSPDVRTALSRVSEARARRSAQRANLFPSVDSSASGRTSRDENRRTDVVSTSESYSGNLQASWEIDLSGKLRQNLAAATADMEQAAENFYGAQVSLAAEVAGAYVNLRRAEAQLVVVENSLRTRSETLQITRWTQEAGEGDGLATRQAVSNLEQARASIPSLRQTITETRNQLTLLSGRTPGALDTLLAKSNGIPPVPAKLAAGIPADTLRQRPDVRAAGRGVAAAYARTRAAEAERLPSLNLSGSFGVDALKAGRIFSPESTAGSLLGSLSAPVFDAGRIRQNIAIQSEQEKQALIAYESSVLQALSEVENALSALRRIAERLAILETATTAARGAADIADKQYRSGQADILVVLDAQRTLLSLEDQRVSALADQASAHIQLYRALGGGWSPQ